MSAQSRHSPHPASRASGHLPKLEVAFVADPAHSPGETKSRVGAAEGTVVVMKRTGKFSNALARLGEGFLAGLVVLVVANVGYPGAGHRAAAKSERIAFVTPSASVR